jgi:branched-chain amino acid transport system ATP-binding protein
MLKIKGINSGYGKVPVLSDLSFQVDEHETVTIIGPNGAGKSTLLKSIVGLVKPSSGTVEFNNQNLTGKTPDQMIRYGLAYVPEGGHVFPNMSVLDNIHMGAFTVRENVKNNTLEELFDMFPILKVRSKQMARTLSGGERQMLAIARGLISRPKLLMLDEPSLGLAPKLVDEIYEKIHMLKETGLTVLLIEQNTSYALELADRGYVLENGKIVLEGDCKDLAQSDHVRKAYLGL